VTIDGIETMDLILDAVVNPAGEWPWKEYADFDRAVAHGLLDFAAAAAAAAEVRGQLGRRQGPVSAKWIAGRPRIPGSLIA